MNKVKNSSIKITQLLSYNIDCTGRFQPFPFPFGNGNGLLQHRISNTTFLQYSFYFLFTLLNAQAGGGEYPCGSKSV